MRAEAAEYGLLGQLRHGHTVMVYYHLYANCIDVFIVEVKSKLEG